MIYNIGFAERCFHNGMYKGIDIAEIIDKDPNYVVCAIKGCSLNEVQKQYALSNTKLQKYLEQKEIERKQQLDAIELIPDGEVKIAIKPGFIYSEKRNKYYAEVCYRNQINLEAYIIFESGEERKIGFGLKTLTVKNVEVIELEDRKQQYIRLV